MIDVTPSLLVQLIDDFLNISFYFVCIVLPASFAWAASCACSAHRGQKRALELLDLELQLHVRCHVGAKNEICVLKVFLKC